MKTKLVLFGKQINLASRGRRRRFVAVFYGIFGVLLLANWTIGSHTSGGFLTVEFTVLVGPILGGYFFGSLNLFGSPGLVEPFAGNAMIARRGRSGVYRALLGVESDRDLRNDERALLRRDYAHYVAYRFLGTVVAVAFLLDYCNNSILHTFLAGIGISSDSITKMIYCLLQIGYISLLTLPQSILLWTEPDMEEEA